MPGKAIIAAASGAAAGVTATIVITGEGPRDGAGGVALMMAAWFFAMVSITVIALAAMRGWIRAHDERTHKVAQQIAIERSAFIEASSTRVKELNAREERLNQRTDQASAYVMSIAARLDEALTRNTYLERHLAEMAADYDALARDHTVLIRETLQERADRFSRRTAAPAARKAAGYQPPAPSQTETPVRSYADPEGGHHPVAPIELHRVRPPARLADAQHERPVEGVGGSA